MSQELIQNLKDAITKLEKGYINFNKAVEENNREKKDFYYFEIFYLVDDKYNAAKKLYLHFIENYDSERCSWLVSRFTNRMQKRIRKSLENAQ